MVRGYGFFQYDQRFQGRFVIRFFEFSCHISSLPDFLSDKLLVNYVKNHQWSV